MPGVFDFDPETGYGIGVGSTGGGVGSISGATIGATTTPIAQGALVSSPGSTSVPNTAAANPTANASTNPSVTVNKAPQVGSLADYFARAIIIILGFIFIAIGLNMLRPGTVPMPGPLRRF